MNEDELAAFLEARGYGLIEVKRWKDHDWVVFDKPPEITYGRLICSTRIEKVPNTSWPLLFGEEVKY